MLLSISPSNKAFFQHQLILWDKKHNTRKHIWSAEKDAYRVWIREIMLQQTRVEQAKVYYDNFMMQFPTVMHLHAAPQDKVFKAWEGLGYYNRCRNILHTAKLICEKYEGHFPSTYEQIIKLKGIGVYTAAAILSFCHNQNYAVCDGNVERILSRYTGWQFNINTPQAKLALQDLANQFLVSSKSSVYNQAIMDFGATICKPKNPLCEVCPLEKKCIARKKNKENEIPLKVKTSKSKVVYLIFLHMQYRQKVALQVQSKNPLWKQLRLLPFIEITDKATFEDNSKISLLASKYLDMSIQEKQFYTCQQTLTHRKVFAKIITVPIKHLKDLNQQEIEWIQKSKLNEYAFPILMRSYFETNI